MADIGATPELVNAEDLRLEVGSDEYVKAQDLFLHISRVSDRNATTDGNVDYVAGKGNSWFTVTLLFTTPEASSLNTLTQTDTNGDWTSTDWKFVGTGRDASTVTYAATGVIETMDISAGANGATKINLFVIVTGDTVPDT